MKSFSDFKEIKGIDKTALLDILEDAFRKELAKMYGSDENFDIVFNPENNDCEIIRTRTVVEDGQVENENKEISFTEANQIDEYEVGEEVYEKIDYKNFGRRVVLNLRQTIASKTLDIQKMALYDKYKEVLGTIITGEVYQTWKREVLMLDDEGNEMFLPKSEQIPTETFKKGDLVRALVLDVDNKNNNPKIILSRTSPDFLSRLFEQEVPEISDGRITIKKVARIPGEQAKVAVESYDERIDAVGACVGIRGARIHGIVRELRNENIDVITYSNSVSTFIARALAPAKVISMELDEENKSAIVFIKAEEISKAIGKNGRNIRLAGMLTGYRLDVRREDAALDEEDVRLSEFTDEIDEWVIKELEKIGCDTAKSVLRIPREELMERADLDAESVDEVLRVLNEEFQQDNK